MSNHLIIGLGGTGGKIIRALRKTIFNEFKDKKPDDVFLRYLYVDTSNEMMDLDDPTWKVMGNSVQLGVDSKLYIKAENLSHTLEEIDRFPGIKPWIGNRQDWLDLINDSKGQKTAGGQRRRLGRFIFASNISSYNSAHLAKKRPFFQLCDLNVYTYDTNWICR